LDTSLAVLTAAAALIENGGHCQGNDALDATGKPVLPILHHAHVWSATGALVAAGRESSGYVFLGALRALAVAVGARIDNDAVRRLRWDEAPDAVREWCEQVWSWEDAPGRTPEHVLRAFDRAKEEFNGSASPQEAG
jgi:hypothetical protein